MTAKAPETTERLFLDADCDACLEPKGRANNLVALAANNDDGGLLNPEAWHAMIQRFNDYPAVVAERDALREALSLIAVIGYSDDPKVAANIARMAVGQARAALAKQEPKE